MAHTTLISKHSLSVANMAEEINKSYIYFNFHISCVNMSISLHFFSFHLLFLLIRYLVQFLSLLSEQQAINKMTPSNIAIVLGPNLLWPRAEGYVCLIIFQVIPVLTLLTIFVLYVSPSLLSQSLCLVREAALFDMASASSVQVVTVIEPLIQYSSDLFPEGKCTLNVNWKLFFEDLLFSMAKRYIHWCGDMIWYRKMKNWALRHVCDLIIW